MAFLVIAFLLLGVLAAGAVAIAWFSMHPPRYKIRETPAAFGATCEEVSFASADGTRLEGWWVAAPDARAVLILCHGMSAHRGQLLPWAGWLWEAGYSLLLFDFRAMGRSGGDLCTMGLYEPDDVIAAVDYASKRAELPIGALGFSMGGVAVMLAAARDPRIRAISTLGSYTSLDSAIAQRCRRHFGPLAPAVERPARKLGARWFPGDPLTVDCVEAVRKIAPRPCFFANGMRDPIVPHHSAEVLYAAAGEPKRLLLLPNTTHDYPSGNDRTRYEACVREFFHDALIAESAMP